MGDRGNIVVRERDGSDIFLYGHWAGEGLPGTVRQALKAARMDDDAHGSRWDDAHYLAAFVFRAMDDASYRWPGCAISRTMPDNEYPVIVLDTRDETVRLLDGGWPQSQLKEREQHWTMKEVADSDDPARLFHWNDEEEDPS